MNERIKELWDRASELETDPSWEGQTKFMEKFAELIVRECSRIADGWVDNDDNGKNYPSEKIKEYFGVEQ